MGFEREPTLGFAGKQEKILRGLYWDIHRIRNSAFSRSEGVSY